MAEINTVKVFYQKGNDPFIFEVNGKFTIPSLEEIEQDLQEYENWKGDGEYLFRVHREQEQRGDFGRIEVPAYWDVDLLEFKPVD